MYQIKSFPPIQYWKKLNEILFRNVPILYKCIEDFIKPIVLSQEEFNTASMILNNVR